MITNAPICPVLPVSDFEKAKKFYRDQLGLKLVEENTKAHAATFEAGKGTWLEIFESPSRKSEDTAASFKVNDIEATMKELRAKGVKFEEYDMPPVKTVNGLCTIDGMSSAWFKDPAGNILCLNQR
jgi:catechol 2,3-dioxygenase-like lactoylglutathione lyase family enzyme